MTTTVRAAVSASAVRLPFGIPAQTKWYPEDLRFVLVVLLVGAVVVTLAILGFKKLAQFAQVCVAWMFLMFVAGALVMLPWLSRATGLGEIRSFSQFWSMAGQAIWTGHRPDGEALQVRRIEAGLVVGQELVLLGLAGTPSCLFGFRLFG